MGQAMSYPPLDVVIDVAKFLWFEDIHTATTVSRTVKDMMETETDLWRCLLSSVVNRVLSVPYGLHLERTDTIITKLLFQRFCDFPTSVDSIIFGKYKGPKNVSIEDISVGSNLTVNFQRPITASSLLHEVPTRRTIVASNSFPYLMGSTKVPRALVPFTKIMMSSCPAKRVAKRMRVQSVHIASLSSVAYFECTMCKSPLATCEVQQIDGQNHSKSIFRIGVACSPFIIRTSLPGDDSFSFGYDSSTGHVVQSHLPCGPPTEPYGAGDTVGCGIVYPLTPQDDGCIFFTKNGRLQQKVVLSNFFSICWFPVMGVSTTGSSSVSMNFGVSAPFIFDVNSFETGTTRAFHRDRWPSLSEFYAHFITTLEPPWQRKLHTKYIASSPYVKKNTYSLFANNTLLHQTMVILDPETYKNQGAILSDSEDDSSSDDDG